MPSPEESNAAMALISKFQADYAAGGVGLPPGADWVDTAFAYMEHAGVYDDEAQARELLQGYGVLLEGDPPPPAEEADDAAPPPEAPSFDEAMDLPEWWAAFRAFTETEYSSENPDFLDAVRYQSMDPQAIADTFIGDAAPRQVNISAADAQGIADSLAQGGAYDAFDGAVETVQGLLRKDTYPRFLKADAAG